MSVVIGGFVTLRSCLLSYKSTRVYRESGRHELVSDQCDDKISAQAGARRTSCRNGRSFLILACSAAESPNGPLGKEPMWLSRFLTIS